MRYAEGDNWVYRHCVTRRAFRVTARPPCNALPKRRGSKPAFIALRATQNVVVFVTHNAVLASGY
jgi:hypothetical protein